VFWEKRRILEEKMQKRKKAGKAKLENTKKSPKGKAFIFYWNIGTNAFFLTSLYIYIYIYLLLFNNLQTSNLLRKPLFLVPLYWNTLEHPEHPKPLTKKSQIRTLHNYVICDIIRFQQGVVCIFLFSSSPLRESFFNNLVSGVFYASVP